MAISMSNSTFLSISLDTSLRKVNPLSRYSDDCERVVRMHLVRFWIMKSTPYYHFFAHHFDRSGFTIIHHHHMCFAGTDKQLSHELRKHSRMKILRILKLLETRKFKLFVEILFCKIFKTNQS